MSVRVQDVCDRCGKSWFIKDDKQRQLWHVEVRAASLPTYASTCGSPRLSADWCRPCMDQFGVLRPAPHPETPEDPPPTASERLEELVREIAREEVAP